NTALQWVVLAGGSLRMIRLLLKHGARGDIANEEGELPADIADEQGSEAAANLIRQVLISVGPDWRQCQGKLLMQSSFAERHRQVTPLGFPRGIANTRDLGDTSLCLQK
ncbi:unnamed protein product, partial [Polarella glacialis]